MFEDDKSKPFEAMQYHIFKDYEIPFDEKGSTCGVVRLAQWVKAGKEPEESKAKVEIRKIYFQAGEEKAGRGYSFSTPEGPSELVHGLIKVGFGDTKEILRQVRMRDDFMEAATTINEDNEGSDDGEMFDMRDLFKDIEEEDEEDASES
ncbi:MAG: hypothetical protein IKR19_08180 [Acholeplasmatales bacterium]|nr:hypothetical protein [Acholeplasmatales bacterium]